MKVKYYNNKNFCGKFIRHSYAIHGTNFFLETKQSAAQNTPANKKKYSGGLFYENDELDCFVVSSYDRNDENIESPRQNVTNQSKQRSNIPPPISEEEEVTELIENSLFTPEESISTFNQVNLFGFKNIDTIGR